MMTAFLDGFFVWFTGSWGFLFSGLLLNLLNMGLMMGLTFGTLILLRPVTNRLLRPGQRLILWDIGWYMTIFYATYDVVGTLNLLPISFRGLVAPRTEAYSTAPAFLPQLYVDPGPYSIVLPGGWEFTLELNHWNVGAIELLSIAVVILLIRWGLREERKLSLLGRKGEKITPECMAQYGLTQDDVVVRLCEGLPTSFVCSGYDEPGDCAPKKIICIQRELPEARLRLVLLHEREHIRHGHLWSKGYAFVVTLLCFWNPILWAAYRLTCRDMELACDDAVMRELDETGRRDYARALVELASGRHLWGAVTTFGECDAALRIRRVAAWRPKHWLWTALSWPLTALLVVFFYCGS